VWLDVDKSRAGPALEEALEKLDGPSGEVVLDFSFVDRVDPCALKTMEKLAKAAGDKGVKVVLRGVNVRTYKTLKLMKVEPGFIFQN
jgi:anti-anti-sigma regulatory factor